jgi:hypothetical protein
VNGFSAIATGTGAYIRLDKNFGMQIFAAPSVSTGSSFSFSQVFRVSTSGTLVLSGTPAQYVRGDGAFVTLPTSGMFVKRTVLTASSGTFTTQATTNTIIITGVGGGGGSGSAAGSGTSRSATGGGGSGSPAYKVFSVSPSTGYSYTCGAGGTAGTGGSSGGNGGNSTFVVGAVTVTAKGGNLSGAGAAATGVQVFQGGVGGAAATNDDLGATGQSGTLGISMTGFSYAGTGGASIFGGDLGSYGAGGHGSASTTATQPGNAGGAGCWLVEEYT